MNQQLALTGTLTYDHRLATVLESIAAQRNAGLSLLRLNELAEQEFGGRVVIGVILISNGKYICAAIMHQKGRKRVVLKGYPALRTLCAVAKAEYEYVLGGTFQHELNLNIPIARIIELAPSLPEQAETLQNDNVFLDRIFGTMSNMTSIQPVEPLLDTSETKDADANQDDDWNAGPDLTRQIEESIDTESRRQRALAEASSVPAKAQPSRVIESAFLAKLNPRHADLLRRVVNPVGAWLHREIVAVLMLIALVVGLYQASYYLTAKHHSASASGNAQTNAPSHKKDRSGRH